MKTPFTALPLFAGKGPAGLLSTQNSRRLVCTMLLFLYSFSRLWAQWPPPYRPAAGDKLTYRVEAGSKKYELVISLTKLSEEGVAFDYATTKPDNRKGMVAIAPEDLRTALRLQTLFAGGTVKETGQTAVFISQAVAKAAEKDTVTLSLDGPEEGAAETFTRSVQRADPKNPGILKMHVPVEGGGIRNLSGPLLENADGTRLIGLFTAGEYPMVTFLKAGFTMYLTGIKYARK